MVDLIRQGKVAPRPPLRLKLVPSKVLEESCVLSDVGGQVLVAILTPQRCCRANSHWYANRTSHSWSCCGWPLWYIIWWDDMGRS